MSKTSIEWTDVTWNPTTGCDRVSSGCAHCYAKAEHDKRHKAFLDGTWPDAPAQYHQPFEVVQTHAERLEAPLHWRAPRMVFVDSVSDLFYGNAADRRRCEAQGIPFHPVPFEFIDDVFAVMALTPHHTYQILTKRADRALEYFTGATRNGCSRQAFVARAAGFVADGLSERFCRSYALSVSSALAVWPLPNVWIGVSVENQRFADERIPQLLQTPAATRFVSAEPLLGPIDLTNVRLKNGGRVHALGGTVTFEDPPDGSCFKGLDLVIVGGESGRLARPFHLEWARALVRQCHDAGAAVFVKQLGSVPVMDAAAWREMNPKLFLSARNHRKVAENVVPLLFYAKKAGNPAEWPGDLQVREFPRRPAVRA